MQSNGSISVQMLPVWEKKTKSNIQQSKDEETVAAFVRRAGRSVTIDGPWIRLQNRPRGAMKASTRCHSCREKKER